MALGASNSSLRSTCGKKMEPVSSQWYMVGGQEENLINCNKRFSGWIQGETFSPMDSKVAV